jgi:hypothetical protein
MELLLASSDDSHPQQVNQGHEMLCGSTYQVRLHSYTNSYRRTGDDT